MSQSLRWQPSFYVDPEGCIDCGARIPACTSDSIFVAEEPPKDKKAFLEKNADYFEKQVCDSGR
jgi:ferredoxin